MTTPRVIYLDGAGWYASAGSVQRGLRAGGFRGAFESFTWTTFLGAGADHLVGARSAVPARRLAGRIESLREANPKGTIHLVGLSAGTAVILNALEELPDEVQVDQVVLLSSSVSARRNLAEALRHVGQRLYATCSERDGILATLAVSADGRVGKVAGQRGFVVPEDLDADERREYAKVVNLPWRAAYAGFEWDGGHVKVARRDFIAHVIAPRLAEREPHPLDRPLVVLTSESNDNPDRSDG